MKTQNVELLEKEDHMSGMQHHEMTITSLTQPFDSIIRLRGKIETDQIELWSTANLAVRIDVEQSVNSRPISRIYTIRSFDKLSQEIEIDLVRHSSPSPAMRWLNTVRIGAKVALTGPRVHTNPNFETSKKCYIFADDTGIPAVYAMLHQWPEHVQAEIFLDTHEAELLSELPDIKGVNYHLINQTGLKQNAQNQGLFEQVQQLECIDEMTIWAACERQQARQIREFCLKQLKMAKEDVRVFGYWKAGVSSSVIDEARLEHYSKLVQQGQGLTEFDDLDVKI
ncbi:siderophore-interacting protein [Acinetobacter bereziniae]|jgi:NADPH-dependent ferric siderophore reductase|uniref:siderophore-interacting protein n=1 Tax=Acinetobacter bereziniae TaxID=106648 RepID=UPI00124FFA0F|nr:siderophore-interacting protein [Acinetobacter bereziniae]MDA3440336.1 siderophore-interacting protein [Acinetobacter bereziniae]